MPRILITSLSLWFDGGVDGVNPKRSLNLGLLILKTS
jgi:hypothetical protein